MSLLALAPIPILRQRLASELAADFASHKPTRFSRAPGRLDVMGGIADYTGSLVCQATLDSAAAVALQERDDCQVQIVSLNLLDQNQPFTFRIPVDALAARSIDQLRADFNEPGRRWAGYLAGCLKILHDRQFVDLTKSPGLNLALLSTVPLGAGVSSSAAIEVAAMINLCAHFQLLGTPVDPMTLSVMCRDVENRIVGAPCGIMDQVASCCGQPDSLLRLVCQPHDLQPPLKLPDGVHVVGIDSRVKHSVGGGMYGRTRCAAFMGHRLILEKMRQMGHAAGKTLDGDPMNGYLANLAPDDYKRFFRPYLPESINGRAFLDQFGPTIDTATTVDANVEYHVQKATDHHVLDANRVRRFVTFMEAAAAHPPGTLARYLPMTKAGHLMFGSHVSYTNDAMLGAAECDTLVRLVRQNQSNGLYGARVTGGGCGGTVAILCDITTPADQAIAKIMTEYRQLTGCEPKLFSGSSLGAWQAGTETA